MKSILEEIWYCNIDPQVDATRDNKEVESIIVGDGIYIHHTNEKLHGTILKKTI